MIMNIEKLLLLLVLMAMVGCVESTKNNIPVNQPTLERAAVAAQYNVKLEFGGECKFIPDIQGEETQVPGRFKVLQKFTTTRYGAYETPQEFVYKIFIEFKGEDATSPYDWDFTELIVENCSTGEQKIYKHGTNQQDIDIEHRQVRFGGVMFTVVEETPEYLRVTTPKQLSHAKLKAVAKEMKPLFSSVFFHVEGQTDRGNEYAAIQGNNLFDYNNTESISAIE